MSLPIFIANAWSSRSRRSSSSPAAYLRFTRLNVDAFPDVTPVQVEIDTEAEGLAPQEVEQLVTFPIENVMNGIPGVTRVESNRNLACRS